MTQVGCVAQTTSGLSYAVNSRRRLPRSTGWIQAQISHGQSLPEPLLLARAALMPTASTRGMARASAIRAKFVVVRARLTDTGSLSPASEMQCIALINKEPVMAATSMVHVRVDEHLKTQATETLALKAPNADTRAAMEEARTISKARFASAKALMGDPKKGAKR